VRELSLEEGLRGAGASAVDLAIDTSGNAGARREALDALDRRGALVCVGHGGQLDLNVSRDLIQKEHAVVGSEYFRLDELPANLERLRAHRAYLGQIITHRFSVDELQRAFETFFAGETGKVIVEQ